MAEFTLKEKQFLFKLVNQKRLDVVELIAEFNAEPPEKQDEETKLLNKKLERLEDRLLKLMDKIREIK